MAITPNANLSTTYNEIIVEGATELLQGRLAVGSLIANSVSDMGARHGNTIRYHRAPKGTIQNAADGSSKTYATPVGGTDELVLNFYKELPLEAGDLDFTIADPEMAISAAGKANMARYAESAAKQLSTQIDTDILEAWLDDSNIGDATVVGDPTVTLNDQAFRDIRTTLIKNGVDLSDIMILLSPDHTSEAMGLDVFRNADFNTARPQINGQFPLNVYGMSVYQDIVNLPNTNDVPSISGSSTTNFVSMAISRNAGKFVMPAIVTPSQNNAAIATSNAGGISLRLKTWYDPDLNTSRLVVDALYGGKLCKEATVQSATDVVNCVPLLGGVA